MKKIIALCLIVSSLAFALPTKAADEAVFSATSDKTSYSVGDDVKISLNVNAGPYASTLSVIDFKLKISEPTVVAPVGASPLTPGTIFTNTVTQSYANGVLSAVLFIDPNNKPANRSGVIGTITMKAQKAGSAVISYDSIKATEENNEMEYITTSASSLTVTVGGGVAAQTTADTSSSSSSSSTSAATTASTRTATPQPARATTGPAETVAFSVIAGILLLISIRLFKKVNTGRI